MGQKRGKLNHTRTASACAAVRQNMEYLNYSSNMTFIEDPSPEWSKTQIMTAVVYPSIVLLSAVGNVIVIMTVIRSAAMRTNTNLFIANLAVSDLLMTFVSAPLTPMALYITTLSLPGFMCHFLPMTMGTSLYVSTLTSTAIAVDRYIVIVHPFTKRISPVVCGQIITTVWLVSILVSLPNGIYQTATIDPYSKVVRCGMAWPNKTSQTAFTVITSILQFVVPCLVISVCYYRVSCALRARCETKIGSGMKSREKEESDIRRKRRTNRLLIAMVIILVICWIPLHAFWIVVDVFQIDMQNNDIFIWCHMLAMSSTVYNPFLYAWLNNNFRQEFKAILQCKSKRNATAANSNKAGGALQTVTYFTTQGQRSSSQTTEKITKCVRQTPHRLTIADGDGGVWHGPSGDGAGGDTEEDLQIRVHHFSLLNGRNKEQPH